MRSYHIEKVTAKNLRPIINEMVAKDAHLMTDTSTVLKGMKAGRKHSRVNHSKEEYVRFENGEMITTNSIEGVESHGISPLTSP